MPTEVPAADPGDLSTWKLSAVGGLGFLAGGAIGPDRYQGPPVLWVSGDGGASFQAPTGFADEVDEGDVRAVVAVDDVLVALGTVVPAGGSQRLAVTWTSGDRGRSWERRDHPELGSSEVFASSAVASGDRVLATTATGLVASTDAGRTWDDVDAPVDFTRGPVLEADGDVVVVTYETDDALGARRAAVSTDGGRSWVRSELLPEVPDREGTGTALSAPRHVRQVADGDLIAVASTVENYDLYLPYLVRSEDGGRTWTLAEMAQDCASEATIGPLAVVQGLAVAVVDCAGPRRTDLVTSTDGGRTWIRSDDPALGDRRLGFPFPSGEREVTLLAGRGAVVHISVDG